MARLPTYALFLVALQVCMLLFYGSSPIQSYSTNSTILPSNAFWDVVLNVQNWNSLAFFQVIGIIALGVIATGMFIGAVMGLKTDFMVFAIMIPSLISLGFPIVNFTLLLHSGLSSLFCGTAITNCPAAIPFDILIGGAMGLYYVFCIMDWWRGR